MMRRTWSAHKAHSAHGFLFSLRSTFIQKEKPRDTPDVILRAKPSSFWMNVERKENKKPWAPWALWAPQ
jgi:hypothetical protein